mmetsp:Transcript_23634/g.51594  ORF Transcript_23634/g.51594 Transcript_23634/m.51594 type:complete len:384 (-) Transcript_23634:559-1710(-)
MLLGLRAELVQVGGAAVRCEGVVVVLPRLGLHPRLPSLDEAERLQDVLEMVLVLVVCEKSHPLPVHPVRARPVAVVVPVALLPHHLVLGERRLDQRDHQHLDVLPFVVHLIAERPHALLWHHHRPLPGAFAGRLPEHAPQRELILHLHQDPALRDIHTNVPLLNPERHLDLHDHLLLVLGQRVGRLDAPRPRTVPPEKLRPVLAGGGLGHRHGEHALVRGLPGVQRHGGVHLFVPEPSDDGGRVLGLQRYVRLGRQEDELFVGVSGGYVTREVQAPRSLGPHVKPGELQIVCHHGVRFIVQGLRSFRERAYVSHLVLFPVIWIFKKHSLGILYPFFLQFSLRQLIPHYWRVHHRPMQPKLALPVLLARAEVAEVHLANIAYFR